MAQMLALVIVVAVLFIGDMVSVRTKAWVPSVFVCAVLFLLGYWTFFPQDIVAVAGIPPAVASMMIYLLITNMGTLLSLQQLKEQWKTILISLAGILGIVVVSCSQWDAFSRFSNSRGCYSASCWWDCICLDHVRRCRRSRACHIVRIRNRHLRNARLCRLSVNVDCA